MSRHILPLRLEQLAHRVLSPRGVVEVARHVVHCPACRKALEELTPSSPSFLRHLSGDVRWIELDLGASEEETVLALSEAITFLEPDRHPSPDLPPVPSWGLVEVLLARCWKAWPEDPASAEELGAVALAVADRLPEEVYGRAFLADLNARTWCYIGNARRIRSDFAGAQRALDTAEALLTQGTHDPLERAEILNVKSILLRDRRQFEPGERILDQVIAIYRWAGDRLRQCRAMVSQAVLFRAACRQERAIELLEEAETMLDFSEDPRLLFSIKQSLGVCITEIGEPGRADALLPETRRLAEALGSHLDLVRVDWLEGLIATGLGQDQRAEDALRRAREAFIREGIGYDAAIVSLDLATLYLRGGRTTETRDLAAQMLPIFQSLDIHREAFATLITFCKAAEREKATVTMVQEMATLLKHSRSQPKLRYELPS